MKKIYLLLFTLLLLATDSNAQKNELKLASTLPQQVFPARNDNKWKAIRALSKYKEDLICDSLFEIYNHIDTAIKGYGGYYDAIFYTLVEIIPTKPLLLSQKSTKPGSHLLFPRELYLISTS